MKWYLWIAAYMIIIAGFLFWVVPEKPLWFIGLIIVLGLSGYYIIVNFPRDDKHKKE